MNWLFNYNDETKATWIWKRHIDQECLFNFTPIEKLGVNNFFMKLIIYSARMHWINMKWQ